MNLRQIQKRFGTETKCLNYLEKIRWVKTVLCPYCDSDRTIRSKSEQKRHHCYNCKRSFSVFVNTIFEDTRLEMPSWFLTIGIMLNAKMGVSALQISRQVGTTVKTAWLTAMKIRCAMIDKKTKLHGILEMDESYFSSSPAGKKMTKYTPLNTPIISNATQKRGRGTKKIPVVGIVEKQGKVKTKIIEKLTARNLMAMLKHYVKTDESILITDKFRSYDQMEKAIEHISVKHKEQKGIKSTSTIEGYWSLIKNGIRGNYKSLSQKYLPFYLVEYEYKYNRRRAKHELFDEYIKNALTEENCMINYKPTARVKTIVYSDKHKPKKVA